jgi:hypothetical protein
MGSHSYDHYGWIYGDPNYSNCVPAISVSLSADCEAGWTETLQQVVQVVLPLIMVSLWPTLFQIYMKPCTVVV